MRGAQRKRRAAIWRAAGCVLPGRSASSGGGRPAVIGCSVRRAARSRSTPRSGRQQSPQSCIACLSRALLTPSRKRGVRIMRAEVKYGCDWRAGDEIRRPMPRISFASGTHEVTLWRGCRGIRNNNKCLACFEMCREYRSFGTGRKDQAPSHRERRSRAPTRRCRGDFARNREGGVEVFLAS